MLRQYCKDSKTSTLQKQGLLKFSEQRMSLLVNKHAQGSHRQGVRGPQQAVSCIGRPLRWRRYLTSRPLRVAPRLSSINTWCRPARVATNIATAPTCLVGVRALIMCCVQPLGCWLTAVTSQTA